MQGVVKWWSRRKGFGFVTAQDQDYFIHISALQKDSELQEGDKVYFEPKKSPKGFKAVKVRKID